MPVRSFIFFILLCHSRSIAHETKEKLIVWNVGQGLWTTLSKSDTCIHIDTGGEFFASQAVKLECGRKVNFAVYTHWDTDHVNFAVKAATLLNQFCVLQLPRGHASFKKLRQFEKIKNCDVHSVRDIVELAYLPEAKASANGQSRIFFGKEFLISGDSPASSEKRWARKLAGQLLKIYIAGHHGSKTSSSEHLLKNLSALKLAISSARKDRYGHPHQLVLARLKRFGISSISTEAWGSIAIELNEPLFEQKKKPAVQRASE